MTLAEAKRRIAQLVNESDSRAMADFLLELARQQYLRYASEVAVARYQHGINDAASPATRVGVDEETTT